MPRNKTKKISSRSSIHNHQFLTLFVIFLVASLLFIVSYKNANISSQSLSQPVSPVTFSGTTPCADCSGIKTALTLSHNPQTYTLYLEYEGRDTTFKEIGEWSKSVWKTNPAKTVYTLTSKNGNKMYYEEVNNNQIRQLDEDGNEIPATLPFTLTKNK